MKRAAILSFSARGAATAARAAEAISAEYDVRRCAPTGSLTALMPALFAEVDALVFVGACGIAVRAIAPCLRGKTVDPAVIAMDEAGRFVISLLSGHIGGANALAVRLAAALGATPVVTTATDVNGRFRADEWAARHGLVIADMSAARRFSARILERDLPLLSDFTIVGRLPAGLVPGAEGDCGLLISCRDVRPFQTTLLLIPRILHLGIGCRRGTGAEKIDAAVEAALRASSLRREALASASSIDVKQDEAGLNAWMRATGLKPGFFSARALNDVPGTFSGSAFVRDTVGVDNVCERAAMLAAGEGARLILSKMCLDGVTVAVALQKWSVSFE